MVREELGVQEARGDPVGLVELEVRVDPVGLVELEARGDPVESEPEVQAVRVEPEVQVAPRKGFHCQ